MTDDLLRYVLPQPFLDRYRPVRAHRHEPRLAGYFFDLHAARFYMRLATVERVPPEAVWTVCRLAVGRTTPPYLVNGFFERDAAALGFVIGQAPLPPGAPREIPLVRRLSYKAKVTLRALESLSAELRELQGGSASPEILAFIEAKIARLKQ